MQQLDYEGLDDNVNLVVTLFDIGVAPCMFRGQAEGLTYQKMI